MQIPRTPGEQPRQIPATPVEALQAGLAAEDVALRAKAAPLQPQAGLQPPMELEPSAPSHPPPHLGPRAPSIE